MYGMMEFLFGRKKEWREREREIREKSYVVVHICLGFEQTKQNINAKHEIVESGQTLKSVLIGSRRKLKPALDTLLFEILWVLLFFNSND